MIVLANLLVRVLFNDNLLLCVKSFIYSYRDHSACYCYTKRKKNNSKEYVDHWITYDKPPSTASEEDVFRAQQVTA